MNRNAYCAPVPIGVGVGVGIGIDKIYTIIAGLGGLVISMIRIEQVDKQ